MPKSKSTNKKEQPVKLSTSFDELVNMSATYTPKPKPKKAARFIKFKGYSISINEVMIDVSVRKINSRYYICYFENVNHINEFRAHGFEIIFPDPDKKPKFEAIPLSRNLSPNIVAQNMKDFWNEISQQVIIDFQ